ncbi:hypothetical protein I0P70_12625 [Pontibacter sp. FD36]|nr:hypothetical protein [Pontibacter sp. FD36]
MIQTLSDAIGKEFPDLQDFSYRNLLCCLYRRLPLFTPPRSEFTQQPVA